MIFTKRIKLFLISSIAMSFLFVACHSYHNVADSSTNLDPQKIRTLQLGGGSSGMEQLNDSTYVVVYDLKNYAKGIRLGLVNISDDAIVVSPIEIDAWGKEGISSDLESICAIPGRTNEFLIAESGNWKGNFGRIFHIQLAISTRKAKVLNSFKPPILKENNSDIVGDQYEAIVCLAYREHEKIIILGERGGSKYTPSGRLRWGIWNIKNNTLTMSKEGSNGVPVNAPGNWSDTQLKRSITDIHLDNKSTIWASASEDTGDAGPFYSVIYKLGKINPINTDQPFTVDDKPSLGKEIHGFKIEALSGRQKGINCTHSFGTEDENYGGVWRPIQIDL